MGQQGQCPRCGHTKSWSIRREKRRCAACRYEWRPVALPLRLTVTEWRRLLRWFLLGHSAVVIAQEASVERKRVLRALLLVRQVMARDVPAVFSGTVEIDETYLGGAWRNKRQGERAQGTKRGRGTTKQAVFGILARGGQVWAQVVPNVEAKTLLPLLKGRVEPGTVVCSDSFKSYTGVAAGGYVHRFVDHSQRFSDGQGNHINGLEGFWGYLKRRLAAKGGIRRERLPLYLAEYVWRYNHRQLSRAEQLKKLLKLLQS
ncbi:MAG: IS1595 family transposase [Dehalococcoidia bacterium]|nr:IS1595 family transposase [Dehalococcoidia bacterium]